MRAHGNRGGVWMIKESRLVFIVGDSASTNSLGRTLSLAITAGAIATVRVLTVDDGPTWRGAAQFEAKIEKFQATNWRKTARTIKLQSENRETAVWVTKCSHPVDKIAKWLSIHAPRLTLLADFDDNDIAIMETFKSDSKLNRLKMPFFRRKSPWRLQRSQARAAGAAHAITFSNPAIEHAYRIKLDIESKKVSALVPHSRRPENLAQPLIQQKEFLFGFPGTIRSHKGIDDIIRLLVARPDARLLTFAQDWEPPENVRSQCDFVAPNTPLRNIYERIEFLLLPMDSRNPAATDQLPAKLVDAALYGTPVLATPTAPIEFYAQGAYVSISDWTDTSAIFDALKNANRMELSQRMRASYSKWFSDSATGKVFEEIAFRSQADKSAHTPQSFPSPITRLK